MDTLEKILALKLSNNDLNIPIYAIPDGPPPDNIKVSIIIYKK